ncbi:hypothetical protein [Streptomyces sp. NPDC096142]|uniref:hypothetical protein n=1 Tax=Streptomyces sp. NPDC096142 TaxID=3366077 RepID=UPI0038045046
MSDENEFVYRNKNTDDVVRYPYRSDRLEMLPNWETLQNPEAEVEPEPPHAPPGPEAPQEPTVTGPEEPPVVEPGVGGDGSGPDAVSERPARSAPKGDWVAYARARAQDSDEEAAIDGLTKEQLVEQYGGDS